MTHLNRARALFGLLPNKDLLDTPGLADSFLAWMKEGHKQSDARARITIQKTTEKNITLSEEELPAHLRTGWRYKEPECDIADLLSALPSTSDPEDTSSGAIVGLRWQFADTRKRSLSIQPAVGS